MTPLIEFKNVSKRFGDRTILDGLNFKIHAGETFCIVGGSGTGKSLTLKILLRLMDVDDGQVLYKGRDIALLNEHELNDLRKDFGMVFQGSALFDSMTVYDNIAYPLREAGWTDEQKIAERVTERLTEVGLPESGDLMPADLSGGMKKRIGLARAIANQPQVVMYDEPDAGLDPANVKRIDRLIVALQKRYDVTSILVTHNMACVDRVANQVALLFNKKIAFQGTLQEFQTTNLEVVRKFVNGDLGLD